MTSVSLIQRPLHTLKCGWDFGKTIINKYFLHAEFIIFKLNISKKMQQNMFDPNSTVSSFNILAIFHFQSCKFDKQNMKLSLMRANIKSLKYCCCCCCCLLMLSKRFAESRVTSSARINVLKMKHVICDLFYGSKCCKKNWETEKNSNILTLRADIPFRTILI